MEQKERANGILGDLKTREEVMAGIYDNSELYTIFSEMNKDFQERFLEFCMGNRGVMMTYDPFFKYIFDPEVHPERLSDFLSQIVGVKLTVKRALPNEHRRISEKGSLLIMDILAETENGELANVEIQKIGYLFPGQRAACYSADMVMRQYEREKSLRGKSFTYKDMKKVYTIVLMEESSKEIKQYTQHYIHRGKWTFDTGLEMELLQEFYFIPLDIFFSIEDNKKEEAEMSELEAWLYFIGSDRPEHIQKIIRAFPKFEAIYRDIIYFRYHPVEAIQMFSDALRVLDENTVNYMIEEMKQELEEKDQELEKKDQELEKKDQEIKRLQELLMSR